MKQLLITLIFLLPGLEVKAQEAILKEYDLFILVDHGSSLYSSHLEDTYKNRNDCHTQGKLEVEKAKLKKGEYAGYYCLAFKKEG